MLSAVLVVLALSCSTVPLDAAKILVAIPTASYSHQVFYRPLWLELANRGHDITLITTDPVEPANSTNLRVIDVSVAYDFRKNMSVQDVVNADMGMGIHKIMELYYVTTRLVFGHAEVRTLFTDKRVTFDLIMIECVFPSSFAFVHRFDAPAICLTSLDANGLLHAAMGNPAHHILYPNLLLPVGNPIGFAERVVTVITMNIVEIYMDYWMLPTVQRILDEAIRAETTVLPLGDEVYEKIDMLFTNSNPLFNAVRPFTPATISLAGGLHQTTTKPLPEDIEAFLDGAHDGAIYFSLGSNVKSTDISRKTRENILRAFAEMGQRVLWKFEADVLPNKPENVMIAKWLPQQDVLRHKNVKVFVTQAGMQSLEEALFAGMPMVAIPYFGDQQVNAHRMASQGLGVTLDHKTLTKDNFKAAVLEVLGERKYKKQVAKMARLLRDQPMQPLERAVWWTEYTVRNKGAKHLKGPKIPMWQFFYLDVCALFLVVFGISGFITWKVTRWSYHKLRTFCTLDFGSVGSVVCVIGHHKTKEN